MENLDENIYEKIQEIFGKMPAKFSVLEEEIDIDLQMEYRPIWVSFLLYQLFQLHYYWIQKSY